MAGPTRIFVAGAGEGRTRRYTWARPHHQLDVTRGTIDPYDASADVDVRGPHALEPQQRVSHEPPVLLARQGLHGQHYLRATEQARRAG